MGLFLRLVRGIASREIDDFVFRFGLRLGLFSQVLADDDHQYRGFDTEQRAVHDREAAAERIKHAQRQHDESAGQHEQDSGDQSAAHAVQLVQNALIAGLCLYLLTWCFARGRIVFVALFTLFSGVDIVPWTLRLLGGERMELFLEGWSSHPYLSHVAQAFWSPAHSIAGWSFIAAYMGWRDGRLDAQSLAAVFALGLWWSPLAALGAAPFLALAGIESGTLAATPQPAQTGVKDYLKTAADMAIAGAVDYARNIHAVINSSSKMTRK